MNKWNVLLGFAATLTIQAATLFSENFESGLGRKWEPVKFEGITEYKVVKEDGKSVLQARAAASASGIGAKVAIPVRPDTKFSWRWKADKTPPGASEDKKKTFDHTARLFV